jgi:hypothetical protein
MYRVFIMRGRQRTTLNSPDKNYEVRECSGGIVEQEECALIKDNLTNAEAGRLVEQLTEEGKKRNL